MTVLELIDELKRYDNDLKVFFKLMDDDRERNSMVDFAYSPADKELTLNFYE